MIREIVYLDRDNAIDLILKADGTAVDLSGVTKVDLILNGTTISSATSPDAFDWSQGEGKLVLTLGDENLTAGSYSTRLVVFDNDNPDGIVWGHLVIVVKD